MLEELAAQTSASKLKGKAGALQTEVNALRAAAKTRDLDGYARHNLKHRLIVEAADNSVLLRVWDSLDAESRARITLERPIVLREAAESHQPIVDALERGDGKTAGKLLRTHGEPFHANLKQSPP